jgi:hypothetical protein
MRQFVHSALIGLTLALATAAPAHSQTPPAGPNNHVQLVNRVDRHLSVRGNVQLNRLPGPAAGPVNESIAFGSCVDCQSLSVALQIDLISRSANTITPRNSAVAVNSACVRCVTVAYAFQYVLQVDDPTSVPPEAAELVRQMDAELTGLQADQSVSLADAETRVLAVVQRFRNLAMALNAQRSVSTEETNADAGI